MAENRDKQKPNQSDAGKQKQAEKQERLSKALRDNLKKRRQQQSSRQDDKA